MDEMPDNLTLADALRALALTQKSVMTSREAAEYLGLTYSDLLKKACRHVIPYYKPNNGRIYFKRDELDAYMMRNRVATDEEIEQEANATLRKVGFNKNNL